MTQITDPVAVQKLRPEFSDNARLTTAPTDGPATVTPSIAPEDPTIEIGMPVMGDPDPEDPFDIDDEADEDGPDDEDEEDDDEDEAEEIEAGTEDEDEPDASAASISEDEVAAFGWSGL